MLAGAEPDGFVERPCSVWVKRDARVGEALGEGGDSFHLLCAGQDSAFEFEVGESVAGVCGFGESEHGFGGEGFLMAQTQPGVVGVGLAAVREVGLASVANVEQIAEDLDAGTLLAFTQKGRNRQ